MTMRCAFAALLCLTGPSAVIARDALLEAALARSAFFVHRVAHAESVLLAATPAP